MPEYRAQLIPWIVAAVIALSALGAYVVWTTRPRAQYNARSLTAHSTKEAARSLHVEGCAEDFIVKPGELVEPRVVPGASLESFRSVYGKETIRDTAGDPTWKQDAFSLTSLQPGAQQPTASVHVDLNQGHVLETLDGIELGIDSFGTIFRKMQDKKVEVHERIDRGPGNWTLILSLYSACGRRYRSEYTRTLDGNPEIDRQIAPRTTGPGGQAGLLRSDVFMNKIVSAYTLAPSGGHDETVAGEPSQHE